jgi:ribosomal protein S18 acetylase RimI-like enzyme
VRERASRTLRAMTTLAPASASVIRPASRADHATIAEMFTRAFRDDPIGRWIDPDAARLRASYSLYVERFWAPSGEITVLDDGVAAACWTPPHAVHTGLLDQLRVLPALARVAGRGLPRVLSALAAFERNHPHEPHWYLPHIGVDPAAQGRGLGSELLEHMLERLDRDGSAAYLDATSERSLRLYERHGFVVTAEERMPKGGPPFWRMWRSSASVAAT